MEANQPFYDPSEMSPERIKELSLAFRANSFPCNPFPFTYGLIAGLKLNGMGWIKSDEAKGILQILIGQSYGQMATVDTVEEFSRLSKVLAPETTNVNKI